MYDDAICAIATPYGVGAISVIRTSGRNSIELLNKVFKGKDLTKVAPNTINYGYIVDNGDIIDEVMVSVFHSPKSFTTENSCEISCHGGVFNTNKVLEVLLSNGFRLANPGEFSTRAFLNGRIDLTESEAIMDIISADNNIALKSAINSLRSSTKKLVNSLREEILNVIAQIEVNIDYPEYDDAIVMTNDIILPSLNKLIDRMEDVLNHSYISNMAIHGIKTAIIGRPNVGKSSLLNMLLDEEKAIVTSVAGTTRDLVEGKLSLGNVTLNLIDTAGIRESSDIVEKIGIDKSKRLIEEAELILLVLDSSMDLTDIDKELLNLTKNKRRIIIANKSDLDNKLKLDDAIYISALKQEGLEELEKNIINVTKLNEFNVDNQNYLSNVRHISLLKEALTNLKQAKEACINMLEVDMIEIDIKEAWLKLGEITGDTNPDNLITELFSKFCLGK
ncbi:MAG: tRNA uridine-5-carboxymethylaminomethyl(34) synthesis GTPase MnmE [Anaeroplasmataceae bacterium]